MDVAAAVGGCVRGTCGGQERGLGVALASSFLKQTVQAGKLATATVARYERYSSF